MRLVGFNFLKGKVGKMELSFNFVVKPSKLDVTGLLTSANVDNGFNENSGTEFIL